ncbi:isoleucine--tRNA ligase [Candidatus Saccharibacteria bacterium QS_5_54_17]|nr:MAG: isoleucine--tRNA ligase [Candidatus Saccharibacteria bacterium QS_5_54_17]
MSGQQTNKHQFAELEEQMLEVWQQEDTFHQSIQNRRNAERFSFLDGPPYANGLPHHGHVVSSLVKDAVARYKTMQGYYVPRQAGWDCHGLPVEQKIEKELGFNSRQEIEEYGIDKFNQACRESVFRYKTEWEQFISRLGRWVDFQNAYATLENEYIESIWWVFKQIWEQDLVYEDYKSLPYCPRCATPLANFEVNQGYQDNVPDPSVYVKFQLTDEDAALVAWTTTPWTLPGNAALAVRPEATYAKVVHNQETLIVAKERLEILNGEYHLKEEIAGSQLVGRTYHPLFQLNRDQFDFNDNAYSVCGADFVGLEEGTGVVHIAPAFGGDDLEIAVARDIPILQTIDSQGFVPTGIGLETLEGSYFKQADPPVLEALGPALLHSETIHHTYPFCWRCDEPLMYYALTTWFIKTDQEQLVKNNQKINWVPGHIKSGRFGKWLAGAPDWSFSRNRYWGAPLPIWRSEDGEVVVIGSIEELRQRAINPEVIDDLHRPDIDQVRIKTDSNKEAARVEEVFDVWFESGAAPYASYHYPFENQQEFEHAFPADFIAEGIDQTRGWFYTLHVEASSLFDEPAFRNAVVSGWVVAADGQKLSKKLKNYTPVDEVFDHYGADTLRYFMATSPVVNGEDVRFSTDYLRDIQRNVFATLFNTYNFFTMYAGVDNWAPPGQLREPETDNPLDRWIIARLHQTVAQTTKQADNFQIMKAAAPVKDLIDDLSNWYVRRSRRRFWRSGNDADKEQAYTTLHYALVRVCQLLAPWAPFLSDYIYRQIRGGGMPDSVHLTDWPEAGEVDEALTGQMETTREIIAEGLARRAEKGVKVRQPLASVKARGFSRVPEELVPIIGDELNIKDFSQSEAEDEQGEKVVELDGHITDELKREGLARDVIRQVQQFRKQSGLEVDDRIQLWLTTDDAELQQAIGEHADTIRNETLANQVHTEGEAAHTVDLEGAQLHMALQKDPTS